ERTDLSAQIIRQENAAMPACLNALRDDGVDAVRFEPKRFFDSRRGAEYLGAPRLHPLHQIRGRQTEMKTHDRRLELLEHIGELCAERGASGPGRDVCGIYPVLPVIRCQCSTPRGFASAIHHWRRMTEEIDVERLARLCPHRFQFLAQTLRSEHGARQGT